MEVVTESAPDLRTAVDELYSMPPEGFVARRAELVKAARAAKDRPLAQQIGALRRPTVGAWMLNLASRASLTSLVELIRLTREIREAEQKQDAARVRELVAGRGALERRVLADLVVFLRDRDIAARPGAIEEVRTTLRAVFSDAAVAEALAEGRLEKAGDYGELDLTAALGAMTSDLAPAAPSDAVPHAADAVVVTPEAQTAADQAEPVDSGAAAKEQQRRARLRTDLDAAVAAERATQTHLDQASASLARAERRVVDLEAQLADARHSAETAQAALSVAATTLEAVRARRAGLAAEVAKPGLGTA